MHALFHKATTFLEEASLFPLTNEDMVDTRGCAGFEPMFPLIFLTIPMAASNEKPRYLHEWPQCPSPLAEP